MVELKYARQFNSLMRKKSSALVTVLLALSTYWQMSLCSRCSVGFQRDQLTIFLFYYSILCREERETFWT